MKFKVIFFLLFSFLSEKISAINRNFTPIKITPDLIYGTDDRYDIYESSDSMMRELARGTAAQILNDKLVFDGNVYNLKTRKLEDLGICKDEPFSSQVIASNCSGFLVTPDTLVTAGHCVNEAVNCELYSWVFDFANVEGVKSSFSFSKNQVFHCVKIIAREKNDSIKNDYAVIKLDRPVLGRKPLKFRTSGKPSDDAVFTVIGHPSGLPLKITSGADMRDNSDPVFFRTNSDTYGGNSGSAVVDSKTGIVEGILVRGDSDYTKSPNNQNCSISVHRDFNDGMEDATRITNIKVLHKIRN